ncbi:unnamed protein product [Phytomonas sp. Hart1]|nr:unnamed protein product [Phytomonas sp. Hart1]|eukprot:CCW66479.1 unnamed protein product [Phytomonas sp. isolate Hart1]
MVLGCSCFGRWHPSNAHTIGRQEHYALDLERNLASWNLKLINKVIKAIAARRQFYDYQRYVLCGNGQSQFDFSIFSLQRPPPPCLSEVRGGCQ